MISVFLSVTGETPLRVWLIIDVALENSSGETAQLFLSKTVLLVVCAEYMLTEGVAETVPLLPLNHGRLSTVFLSIC